MPNCVKCHQPQTAALVICPECYRALTERTVSMEHDKLIEALTYRANQGGYVALRSDESVSDICGECPWTECDKKKDFGWCVFELLQRAADALKAKDAQLAEKDKQLSNARNELCQQCGKYHMAHKGACNGCRWRGPQEAGKVSQTRTAPAWAEQFERRFMGGEGTQ